MQKVIFTDLDGTLLDYKSYSFGAAKPALALAKKKKVPVIINTSKTQPDIEEYRDLMKNGHPFISENGAAIFIPKGYFDFRFRFDFESGDFFVIECGIRYEVLRTALDKIKKKAKHSIKGMGDMTIKEVVQSSGMSAHEAELAKKRSYTEPFLMSDDHAQVRRWIRQAGLFYTDTAKYHYIMGDHDKGRAAKILMKLLIKKFGPIRTIGFGDNLNDIPMLRVVDKPYLVAKEDGSYQSGEFAHTNGIGPVGWNWAVMKELQ